MEPTNVSGTVTISDQRSYIKIETAEKIPQKSPVLSMKFVKLS